MSLLDEAKKYPAKHHGPRCGVARLDPKLRKQLDDAVPQIDGASVTIKSLSLALLNKHKVDLKPNTIARHYRGDCRCESR